MSEKKSRTLKPGWRPVKFGDVVRQCKEKADPETSGLERYIAGDHMDTDDLRLRRWGEIGTGYLGPAFHMRFRPGQVLYGSRRTYLRKVAVADFEGICANTTFVLEPKNLRELLPEFLPFLMQTESFSAFSVKNSKGSVNPYINFSDLQRFEFSLPPMEEQRRFVELIGSITQLEEVLRAAEHEADRLQKAAMQDLLDADLNDWPTKSIGQIFKVTTGGTPSRNEARFWNGDVPWVKTGEVNYHLIESTEECITAEGLRGSSAKLCPPNSVLVALYGQGPTRGRVGILGIEAAVNQACAAIYPSDDYDPRFVYYYLSSKYLSLRAMAQGAAQPNLNLAMIKGFSVPTPTLDEQKAAVASIDAVARAKAEILRRRERTAELKRKMREEAIGNVVH
ncbi:restriction endonuclease subunit S [Dyella jiangningensis]|uniref:restriction endonuclease subunit S n=1 Tax=Dyella jiangningensis TaxID=1379159 RepID=UPI00241082AA|nr:restriction endonuclease subunit S [Dyella jiangningensis]MDG2539824.1 restriction endonuclease subunit S [Dyella jiangningensis]